MPGDFLEPGGHPEELGRLGPYSVRKVIGTGGMGMVYLAEDLRLKRQVALKVMNERFAATANSRKRFLDEARAMAAIDHDHVVRIFEVGEYHQTPFMAMEYLRGETLEALIRRGDQLDVPTILRLGRHVCRGLAAAHSRGIIHRDIKPGNLWLDANTNRTKILDFGLALAQGHLASSGNVVGTPGYLSPEQARNEPLDDRSDLYSLGVVLYELCTGQIPCTNASIASMLIAIITHPTPPVLTVQPEVPPLLAECVDQLLAKEPRDRPASATELEQRLHKIGRALESESQAALQIVTAATKPVGRAKSKPVPKPTAPDSGLPLQTEPGDRNAWLANPKGLKLAAGGTLTGLALLVVLMWMLRSDAEREAALSPSLRQADPARTISPDSSSPTTSGDPQAKPKITADSLAALRVEDLSAADQVKQGEYAQIKFRLVNQAANPQENPARLHARESVLAVCRLSFQGADGVRHEGYVLPMRRSPRQIPAVGNSTPLEFQVATEPIEVGQYTVILTLETPQRAILQELSTKLEIVNP